MGTNLDRGSLEKVLNKVFSFIDPNKICINDFSLTVIIDYFLYESKDSVAQKYSLTINGLLNIINSGRKVLKMTEVKSLKKHFKAELLDKIYEVNELIDLNNYSPVAILEKGKTGKNPNKLHIRDIERGTVGILIVEKTYYTFEVFAENFLIAYNNGDSQLTKTYLAILLQTNFEKTITFLKSNLSCKKDDDPITFEQGFLEHLLLYFK